MAETTDKKTWILCVGTPGLCRSNLMFHRSFPKRYGRFPKEHPCYGNPNPTIFGTADATEDPLGQFRSAYPSASCFPEGDGIAFDIPVGRPVEEVRLDAERCFGVVVKVRAW